MCVRTFTYQGNRIAKKRKIPYSMSDSSDFMARKVKSFVSQLGKDNNGVLTADHLNAIADRCIALTDGDPVKAQKIRCIMQEVGLLLLLGPRLDLITIYILTDMRAI